MPEPKPVVVPPPPPPPKPAPTPPTLANLLSGAVALLKLDAYYAITIYHNDERQYYGVIACDRNFL